MNFLIGDTPVKSVNILSIVRFVPVCNSRLTYCPKETQSVYAHEMTIANVLVIVLFFL